MEKPSLDARREASPTLHDKAAVGGVHDGRKILWHFTWMSKLKG